MGKIIIDGIEYGGCVDTTNFTSSDVADADATSWTSVTPITNNEPNVSLFTKLSQMFKNVRWLYKMLGTTDISAIGDGSVTGAISVRSTIKTETIGLTAENATALLVPAAKMANVISFLPADKIQINAITTNVYGLTYLMSSSLTAGKTYNVIRVYYE